MTNYVIPDVDADLLETEVMLFAVHILHGDQSHKDWLIAEAYKWCKHRRAGKDCVND